MVKFKRNLLLSLIFSCIGICILGLESFAFSPMDSIPDKSGKKTGYFRPAAIIVPTAFLAYGCLKPVIPGIENLDNQIWENIQTHYPDFNTTADDYLQWGHCQYLGFFVPIGFCYTGRFCGCFNGLLTHAAIAPYFDILCCGLCFLCETWEWEA